MVSEWGVTRFWDTVAVVPDASGFTINLDARSLRTPGKARFSVPTRALADAVAAEWEAQTGRVDPRSMPYTRSANAAIDKVATQRGEVAAVISAYGDSDLLCYRAEHPPELYARQCAQWDPILNWAAGALNARLVPVTGVMHRPQNAAALARLEALVRNLSDFELTAFHDLVSLSGSLIIGFAAAEDAWTADELWTASQLDEIWQIERWGADEEASEYAEGRRLAFLHARNFFHFAKS